MLPPNDSARTIEIGPVLAGIFRRHIELGFHGDTFMFRSSGDAWRGTPLTQHTSDNWTRESFRLAGILYGMAEGQCTLHSGRHSCASWMVQRGVTLQVVAEILGNTMETCRKHYAHLIPDTRRAALTAMEAGVALGKETGVYPINQGVA